MVDLVEVLYKGPGDLGECGQAMQTRKEGVSTIRLATSIGRSNGPGPLDPGHQDVALFPFGNSGSEVTFAARGLSMV